MKYRARPVLVWVTPISAVLLATCAPNAPPGAAANPFDGVYAGTYELTGGPGPCNRSPKPAEMTVAQGSMSLAYSPRDNVFFKQLVPGSGAVQASTSAKGVEITLMGQFDGDGFTGETANASCTYRVVMKRK